INPYPAYDEAVQHYVAQVLDASTNAAFLDDFRALQRRISHYGLLNSLAQTLLKSTIPGVPDTYQGTELWDLSLVDPDNRRPVDFGRRQALLDDLDEHLAGDDTELVDVVGELLTDDQSGLSKLFVLSRTLRFRRDHAELFT